MPILSPIQRRSPRGRLLITTMYTLLVVGAAWMVYPFLLMLSGSLKSDVDIRQFDVVPRFLYDDAALFRKFEEQRYWTLDSFTVATRYHDAQGQPLYAFEFLNPPNPPPAALMRDWDGFLQQRNSWPRHFTTLGHAVAYHTVSELGIKHQRHLWQTFPDRPRGNFGFWIPGEAWFVRTYQPSADDLGRAYQEFRKGLPARYFIPNSMDGQFLFTYLPAVYGSNAGAAKKLNQKWGTHYATLYGVTISPTPPTQPAQREDWWNFVRESLSIRFIKFDPDLHPAYADYLRARYGNMANLNKVYCASYSAWNEIQFPSSDAPAAAQGDLQSFLQTLPTPTGISLDAPDFRWRAFLREKYAGKINEFNRSCQTSYASFDDIGMPLLAYDWSIVMKNKREIRWELATRNYRAAWSYLSLQGRAFQNTLLFCALNILTALIVNPIAAYAMSRFQPRWGYHALFFLMATMAFPGEVTQIPAFLMLRDLGMLNSFAALIIPAAANGYSIFLLKGFFDSLPKELYESATLDGASELRIFTAITMPLSAPILAVIALGAFTAAYGAFMFALLVCQKQSMWTLMVFIYQLQQYYGTPIIFASLAMAAIPTLLVFLFCQNIILRGIVIPVEK
ncbi:MAG: carbohydrate ABC transporter permease [Verrucomicrobia bacterium]|nr:carbohydrate ABC transporter permease [Verrucomicrobiota bacterium]